MCNDPTCPEAIADADIAAGRTATFDTPSEAIAWLMEDFRETGVSHDHTTLVDGCFRCDLNRDEMGVG